MDLIKEIYAWITTNYIGVLVSTSIVITGLQGIVRLTPTKKDDSALARIDKGLNWLMDFLKIPNAKREGKKLGIHKKDS